MKKFILLILFLLTLFYFFSSEALSAVSMTFCLRQLEVSLLEWWEYPLFYKNKSPT